MTEPAPAGGRRGGRMLLVLIVVGVLGWITYNTLHTIGPGSRGLPAGVTLPPFAMPLALGGLSGDANVATRADSGGAGRRPACAVRGRQILNVCELRERGPVVLAFIASRGGVCARQLDGIERIRRRFPGVQFAAVAIRGGRASLRRLVRARGWGFPVGYDHDGLVANLYGVAVCPTITFAYPGGRVMRSTVGLVGDGALVARLRELVAGARARGWSPPA